MTTSLERDPMTTTLHPITPALAHVGCAANLLVHAVAAGAEAHCYRSVFAVAGGHPSLYENPAIANHGSGTTFTRSLDPCPGSATGAGSPQARLRIAGR